MEEIRVVIPKGAESNVELGLVLVTETLSKKGVDVSGGLLGGEFGYGADYENDTFMMHQYCWCEKEDCKWCEKNEPNFVYKPTGAKIWWYKWIGRSQNQDGELPQDWLEKCIESTNK